MRKITALFSVLALAVSAVSASAATFSVTPVVTAAFDAGFNALPAIDTTTQNGVARIFEVDLQITTSNLQAGERGFGNVGLNVAMTGGLTEGGAGGYQPNTSTTDANGAAPGGTVALYLANTDGGPAPDDLQGIFATIANGISAPNATDARVKIGQAGGPNSLGKFYVKWAATSPDQLTIGDTIWSVYSTAGSFSDSQGVGGSVSFGSGIPEPASIAMAGMGLIGIVAAARRRKA